MGKIEKIEVINGYEFDADKFYVMGEYSLNSLYHMGNLPTQEMELELPTECPCCKKVLAADIKPIVAVNNLNISLFEPKSCKIMSIYRCTSCNELFVMSNEDNFVKSKKECDETIN